MSNIFATPVTPDKITIQPAAMQNVLAPYGIPRNGIVSIIDPWRDTYGRNILPVGSEDFQLGWISKSNITSATVSDVDANGWRKITFVVSGTSNYYRAPLTIGPSATGYSNFEYEIISGTFTEHRAYSAGIYYLGFFGISDGTVVKVRNPQVNLGQLYPYSPPAGLPQSLTDYSGHGNTFQLGSTAGSDTNDPAWSGAGLVFSADDYCKSSSPVFNDIPQFTCITVFKKATGSAVAGSRFFDKTNRAFYVNQSNGRIAYYQNRQSHYDSGIGNTTLVEGTNYIVAMCLDSATFASKMFVGSTKQSYSINGSGAGTTATDAGHDLYIGNKSSADACFDGTIYCQLWYNRVLSDAEYMQAYNGLKRLMNARGVVI